MGELYYLSAALQAVTISKSVAALSVAVGRNALTLPPSR